MHSRAFRLLRWVAPLLLVETACGGGAQDELGVRLAERAAVCGKGRVESITAAMPLMEFGYERWLLISGVEVFRAEDSSQLARLKSGKLLMLCYSAEDRLTVAKGDEVLFYVMWGREDRELPPAYEEAAPPMETRKVLEVKGETGESCSKIVTSRLVAVVNTIRFAGETGIVPHSKSLERVTRERLALRPAGNDADGPRRDK